LCHLTVVVLCWQASGAVSLLYSLSLVLKCCVAAVASLVALLLSRWLALLLALLASPRCSDELQGVLLVALGVAWMQAAAAEVAGCTARHRRFMPEVVHLSCTRSL